MRRKTTVTFQIEMLLPQGASTREVLPMLEKAIVHFLTMQCTEHPKQTWSQVVSTLIVRLVKKEIKYV